jgi:NAD(P)-dependent dehydrogenase (short-subunit alcohol dehydrogenase family)
VKTKGTKGTTEQKGFFSFCSVIMMYVVIIFIFVLLMPSTASLSLAGKRVLVTGAGRGIGRAIALLLSEEGAKVAISSRTLSELQETLNLASSPTSKDDGSSTCSQPTMSIHVADCTHAVQVESMIKSIVDHWGGLDILINNAGGSGPSGPMETLDAAALTQLLQLNVVGPQIVTSAVVRHAMPADGTIVNISSRAGKIGLANKSFYVASKFALEGLTVSWAKDLKERRIRVNSISPGMVSTQSFPKAPGHKGVRMAESVRDGLMLLLQTEKTGCYLHVDELDQVRAQRMDDETALKSIDEATFDPQAL